MYSVIAYGSMIADVIRMQAYTQALQQAKVSDLVVLDIGTGTGIFALLACQLGARKVYAIEPSDAIQVAREIATVNGYRDRITFIQDLSTQVELPECADVIISDLRGILPWFQQHIPTIIDARQRLLAPGGRMIPQRDTVWAAIVSAPDLYNSLTSPWQNNAYGFNMAAAHRVVTNSWIKARFSPEQCLGQPRICAVLDYTTIGSPHLAAELTWTIDQPGTAHGLCLWFDAVLWGEIGFSNAPNAPEALYGNGFFPWSSPVQLAVGDQVTVTLQANLVGSDYIWRWQTQILDQGKLSEVKAEFRQSTFFAMPLAANGLQKIAPDYLPRRDRHAEVDHLILTLMDGSHSLKQITDTVVNHFPAQFADWQQAFTRVSALSKRYGQ